MPATLTAEIGSSPITAAAIIVPDHTSLLPPRMYRLGGRAHQHPGYSLLSAFPGGWGFHAPAWEGSRVISTEPGCQVTFRKATSTFSFLSLKNGRTQSGEGPHEFGNAIEKEVDPFYVDYQLHGLRIHYEAPDGPRFYTVDCVASTASGEIVAEEVKASISYFAEPSYAAHVKGAAGALGKVGITFSKVTGDDLQKAKRRNCNLKRAFSERFTSFSQAQVGRVTDIIIASGPSGAPMGKVEEALRVDPRLTRPMVNAMLCARHLSFNLGAPFQGDLPVHFAPQAPTALPDIRAIQR